MKDTLYETEPFPYSVTTTQVRREGQNLIRTEIHIKGLWAALEVLFKGVLVVIEGQ